MENNPSPRNESTTALNTATRHGRTIVHVGVDNLPALATWAGGTVVTTNDGRDIGVTFATDQPECGAFVGDYILAAPDGTLMATTRHLLTGLLDDDTLTALAGGATR